MSKQNITIGCLSVSAVFLAISLLVTASFQANQAEASGMIDRGGTYALLSGRLSDSNELVYLLDNKTNQLAVYRYDESSKNVQLTQLVSLDDAPSGKPEKPRLKP